jgi:hypothetical protein
MKFTQIVDYLLFKAERIEEARQFRKDGPRLRYFRALREELQNALAEGVILIERQEAWIP